MASEIYFNIDNGHFKIWGYDIFRGENGGESTTITYYGRVGQSMNKLRKNKKTFSCYGKAYDYIWDKIHEKIRLKEYYSMPNYQYFDIIDQEKPLFQLINLMETYKKAQRA